jgi:hypothetical protein
MTRARKRTPADDERILPWAEGNGMWNAISRLASGLSAVDLVTFLVNNPYTCDTAESLAERIGRHPAQLQPVLDRLVEAGFLCASEVGSLRVYELTQETQRRQTLQQYVAWLQEGYHWTRLAIERS